VVVNGCPPKVTVDVLIKPLPVKVSEKEPGAIVFGLTDVSVGTGFSSATAPFPDFVVSATLVAVTVIVLGLGKFTGAVYNPVVSMVPVAALPPATAFTDHVTLVLVFPVTVAANACMAPARTIAVAGATATVTPALLGGVVGDDPPLLLPIPAQPANSNAKTPVAATQMRFTDLSPIVDSLLDSRPAHSYGVLTRVDG
jgi:hypothetical protein